MWEEKQDLDSLKEDLDLPKEDLDLPKEDLDLPKEDLESPKKDLDLHLLVNLEDLHSIPDVICVMFPFWSENSY